MPSLAGIPCIFSYVFFNNRILLFIVLHWENLLCKYLINFWCKNTNCTWAKLLMLSWDMTYIFFFVSIHKDIKCWVNQASEYYLDCPLSANLFYLYNLIYFFKQRIQSNHLGNSETKQPNPDLTIFFISWKKGSICLWTDNQKTDVCYELLLICQCSKIQDQAVRNIFYYALFQKEKWRVKPQAWEITPAYPV